MNIELSRFRVRKGKSEVVDKWMNFLNENMEEVLLTLDGEKMYVETIFREKCDDEEYLYWYSIQGENGIRVEESDSWIDKKKRRNTRTIIIMRVVKWMNMVSVLLCIIVVRLLISINSIVLYQPDGVVISFVQKESVISAIIVICLFFLSRLVCRKS